jgi:hypothetical protein
MTRRVFSPLNASIASTVFSPGSVADVSFASAGYISPAHAAMSKHTSGSSIASHLRSPLALSTEALFSRFSSMRRPTPPPPPLFGPGTAVSLVT